MKIKYKALGDRTRKEAPLFKQTIFDYVHVDSLNVDPGTYELVKVMWVIFSLSVRRRALGLISKLRMKKKV